jgi:hypothetical protein
MTAITAIARQTLRDPVAGARTLIAQRLPRRVLWMAFWAAVLLDTVLATIWTTRFLDLAGSGMPPELAESMARTAATPILNVPVQAAYWFVVIHALHRVGAAFGGTGSFEDSLHVGVACQLVNLGYLAALVVTALLLPALVLPVLVVGVIYALWLVSGLIRGLHGFSSRLPVILVMVVTFAAIYIAMSVVVAILLPGSA